MMLGQAIGLLHKHKYYPVIGHSASSHAQLVGEVRKYIKDYNKRDSEDFGNMMGQLKVLRVKADYKDVDFTSPDSDNAIHLSKEIRNILNIYIS
jgi:hypothetical protein